MPLEVPQLDDRSFDELVQEALARIPAHTPEWTNFNASDPGVTLVQLFAYMTENLLYRSNRIPEANRLKFLTLLGIGLQPATPGRGLVSFINERGPVRPLWLEEGVELRAGKVPFRTRRGLNVLPVSGEVFYKTPRYLDEDEADRYRELYAAELENPADDLLFYGTEPLPAPQIGTPPAVFNLADATRTIDRSLWVALLAPPNTDHDAVRGALAGQVLTLGIHPSTDAAGKDLEPLAAEAKETADPGLVFEIAAPDLSDPTVLSPARYRALNVVYAENVLDLPGIVEVQLPPNADALRTWTFDPVEEGIGDYPPLLEDKATASRVITWLRVRLPAATDEAGVSADRTSQQTALTWISLNSARVIQAIPVNNERLGVGNGAPNQSYAVANTPVIADMLATEGDPDASRFRVEVQPRVPGGGAAWELWQRVDDIYTASATDMVYTLDPESGEVRFGDGLHGRRPSLGANIRASYEYGGGPDGMVAIDAINKSPALPGGYKVSNPLPTWGASSGETVAEGEQKISRYLRHRDRLVTVDDFNDITRNTPGVDIARVETLPLFNPDQPDEQWPGGVTVMVVPQHSIAQQEPPDIDRLFLDTICQWIDPRRLVTTEIFIREAVYVDVWVTIGLVVMPGWERTPVYEAVKTAVREYLSPLVGGQNGNGWPLGMEVRRNDLEAVAVRVEGVRYVEEIRLGVLRANGTTIVDVLSERMTGIHLPWLAGIAVGPTAAPLDGFLGGAQQDGGLRVPVPVQAKKC